MYTIKDAWKTMLKRIYLDGYDHKKDDADIREYLGNHFKIINPVFKHGFIFSNPAEKFISWMREGAFDIDEYPMKGQALVDYVTSLDDPEKIYISDEMYKYAKGEAVMPFIYTYPERLQALFVSDEGGALDCVNQIDIICDRLLENIGSNRAVACLYQPGIDGKRVDIPCLNWLQVTVRDNTMVLHVMFRSNDIYGAWPSNMYFLTYLGLKIQEIINKEHPLVVFEYIDYYSTSAHIYRTDFDAVKKIIDW